MSELDPQSAEYTQVADRHHRIDHEFRTRDGYAIESQVGTVLSGLGFSKEDWGRQTEEFSGGWQMRIALAKLLLQKPNLLLLDEPTNISIWKQGTGWRNISATTPSLLY